MVKGVEGNDSMRRKFEQMLREAQNKICSAVEELDGEGTFRQDVWERENGGGGISRVMAGGKVWEKAGCSCQWSTAPCPRKRWRRPRSVASGVDRAKGMEPGEGSRSLRVEITSASDAPAEPHGAHHALQLSVLRDGRRRLVVRRRYCCGVRRPAFDKSRRQRSVAELRE